MDVGAALRAAREARGLSLDALSRSTRIRSRLLAAIEHNDIAQLPPRPFGRGFVRAYAVELGLDPAGTVADYFAQFAPPPLPPAPLEEKATKPAFAFTWRRAYLFPLGLAILAVTVLGVTLRQNDPEYPSATRPDTPAPAARPVGTTGAEVKANAARVPSPQGVAVVLEATRRCWVTVHADGARVMFRMLVPGDRETLHAEQRLRIRVGDAGAVRWQLGGRDAAVLGRDGEVATMVVTPTGAVKE